MNLAFFFKSFDPNYSISQQYFEQFIFSNRKSTSFTATLTPHTIDLISHLQHVHVQYYFSADIAYMYITILNRSGGCVEPHTQIWRNISSSNFRFQRNAFVYTAYMPSPIEYSTALHLYPNLIANCSVIQERNIKISTSRLETRFQFGTICITQSNRPLNEPLISNEFCCQGSFGTQSIIPYPRVIVLFIFFQKNLVHAIAKYRWLGW